MNKTSEIVHAVVGRLLLALTGYFSIFSAYIFLFSIHAKQAMGLTAVLRTAYNTLTLPFVDVHRGPELLIRLHKAPQAAINQPLHTELFTVILTSLCLDVALLVLVALSIFLFERTPRTRKTIVFFYIFMPALLWLLWSQVYVLMG